MARRWAEKTSTLILLAIALFPVTIAPSAAEQHSFVLAGYTFLSSTNGPVYPGSTNAKLVVEVEYYGLQEATNIHACISLPEGFTVQSKCVEARNEDGARNTSATYGSLRYFYYTVDVDRSVKPGVYGATLRIKYTAGSQAREETIPLVLRVEKYPEPSLVVEDAWIEPYSYPGSLGVTLHFYLANHGESRVVSGSAEITFPEGFQPRKARLDIPSIDSETGRAEIAVQGIFISPLVEPGTYYAYARLVLDMATSDGVEYRGEQVIRIPLRVEETPQPLLSIPYYEWSSGVVYPGTRGASLRVYVSVLDEYNVEDVEAWLSLPQGFTGKNGSQAIYATATPVEGYGSVFTLTFNSITVSSSTSPGAYSANLSIKLHLAGRNAETIAWYNTSIVLRVSDSSSEELVLVDTGWAQAPVLREGIVEGSVYATLQYRGNHTVSKTLASLKLLNASTRNNGGEVTVYIENLAATRGSVFTLRFNGVKAANSSTIEAVLTVKAYIDLGGGATSVIERSYRITLPTVVEKPLIIIDSHVEYNGGPAAILPNATGLELQVVLQNTMPTTIAYITPVIDAPEWMKIGSITGTCLQGVGGGATCTLTIAFNTTSNAKTGFYPLNLSLKYAYSVDGAYTIGTLRYQVPLVVEAPEAYAATPRLVSWYWGSPGQASPVAYTGSPRQEITLVFYNPSRWSTSLTVFLDAVEGEGLKPLVDTGQCSIGSNSFCTIVLSFDARNALPGTYTLNLAVRHAVDIYGSYTLLEDQLSLLVNIDAFTGQGIVVSSTAWQNNRRVFPGTRDAELVIEAVNKSPWTLQGAEITVNWPPGFQPPPSRGDTVYVEGPIPPLASFTATATVTVSNSTAPGVYEVPVTIRYWYTVNGIYVEVEENKTLRVEVSNPSSLFDYVSLYWSGPAPGPGDKGARLSIVFRVTEPDEAYSPILVLKLPSGVKDAYTGSSIVRLAPGSAPPQQGAMGLEQLVALAAQPEQLSPGFATYTLVLSIDRDLAPGVYNVTGFIDFIDSWGSRHRVEVSIPLPVPGAARTVLVESTPYSLLVNGTANITIRVSNNGSGTVYNLYVFLAPQAPNAYPLKPVEYIPVLGPGATATVVFPLAYSPKSPYGGEASYTFAGIVGVVYQDSSGYLYRLNASISTIIMPPVRLVLTEARAVYTGGVLRVSVSIANLGSMKAERTILEASTGGKSSWTLVGEIDPGDEMPARVELELGAPPAHVTIRVKYFDEYNNVYVFEETVPVKVEKPKTVTSSGQAGEEIVPGGEMGIAVTGAIIAFLVAAFLLIRRYLRRHSEETVPPIE